MSNTPDTTAGSSSSAPAPQPTVMPSLTDGTPAATATVVPPASTGLSTVQKVEETVAALAPVLSSVFGSGGTMATELAELGLNEGNIIYQLFSKHHSLISEHKTLNDAVQAAVKHAHTKHSGTLANRKNPTTWEIIPVIQLGVRDILKHPVPVGSLAKELDTDDDD